MINLHYLMGSREFLWIFFAVLILGNFIFLDLEEYLGCLEK